MQKLYAYVGETDYESLYERIARDIILKEAGEYEAPEYWLNRSKIGNQMKSRLNSSLNEVFADCTAFQFLSIDLPDSYENAIVLTQIENQKKSTFTYKRETSIIESEIQVDRSNATKAIQIINSKAEAEAIKARNTADASIRKVTVENQSAAWTSAKSQIGFGIPQGQGNAPVKNTDLLEYIYYNNLMNLKNEKTTLIFGVDDAMVDVQVKPSAPTTPAWERNFW